MRLNRISRTIALTLAALPLGLGARGDLPKHPAGPPPGYDLTLSFADEFDGDAVDARRWGHVYADPAPTEQPIVKRNLWANVEKQVFFDKAYLGLGIDPFSVANGILTIKAEPLAASARAAVMSDLAKQRPEFRRTTLQAVAYSSGMISTRRKFDQRYGYFEVRARLPQGRGLWPAFWLLPDDSRWPPEIDIMEVLGHEAGVAYHSTHSTAAPRDTTKRATYPAAPGAFHRFGALWLPDRIDYFIDGRKTATIPKSPDMTRPMYMIVSFTIGGKWPGDPEPGMKWPAYLQIDYVRAWKFNRIPAATTQ